MENLQIFEEIDGLTLSSFLTSCFYSLKRLFLFVEYSETHFPPFTLPLLLITCGREQ